MLPSCLEESLLAARCWRDTSCLLCVRFLQQGHHSKSCFRQLRDDLVLPGTLRAGALPHFCCCTAASADTAGRDSRCRWRVSWFGQRSVRGGFRASLRPGCKVTGLRAVCARAARRERCCSRTRRKCASWPSRERLQRIRAQARMYTQKKSGYMGQTARLAGLQRPFRHFTTPWLGFSSALASAAATLSKTASAGTPLEPNPTRTSPTRSPHLRCNAPG